MLGALLQVLTLADAIVGTESIPRRTAALVASGNVDTVSDAQFRVFKLLALVYVGAGPVVVVEGETRSAGAADRSPRVDARLLAEMRLFVAFVDILATISFVPVAIFALAFIGTDSIDAVSVYRTDLNSIFVC